MAEVTGKTKAGANSIDIDLKSNIYHITEYVQKQRMEIAASLIDLSRFSQIFLGKSVKKQKFQNFGIVAKGSCTDPKLEMGFRNWRGYTLQAGNLLDK